MKKKIITTVLLLTAITMANAQVLPILDQYGEIGNDRSQSIALDADGNIYVTGAFDSPTLDLGSITLTNSSGGTTKDVFVAKFQADGSPVWAINSVSPNAEDIGNDIIVDDEYVYITGSFEFDAFSFSGGPSLTNSGGSDMFVACFDQTDGSHAWSFTNDEVAGTAGENEYGEALAISGTNLYITGSFNSNGLQLDGLVLTNSSPASLNYDIYAAVLDVSAGAYSIDLFFNPEGDKNDYVKDICADASGNFYLTGYHDSHMLDFGSGWFVANTDAGLATTDVFLCKYNYAGGSATIEWAAGASGYGNEYAYGIATNGTEVYITGGYQSDWINFFGSTTIISNPAPMFADFYLTKYDALAGTAEWVKTADADVEPSWNFDDFGKDLAIDPSGFVYVTGWYNSFRIDYGRGVLNNETNNNYSETIIAKYQDDGTLHWIESAHGIYNDRGMGVAVNEADGCCVITGWYESDPLEFGSHLLSLANPVEKSDFYIGRSCGYDCSSECDFTADILHTGTAGIGADDPHWQITVDPSGGTVPRPAVGCIWYDDIWSYGSPFAGTNWISMNSHPTAPINTYTFEREFEVTVNCPKPAIDICVMADDSVEVFLNGYSIGSGAGLSTPLNIYHDEITHFIIGGTNTLRVDVHNNIEDMMAFDLKAWLCCQNFPTDITDHESIDRNEMKLYPNPARDILNIDHQAGIERVEMYNYTGRLVRYKAMQSERCSLQIGDLPAGMYILRIYSPNGEMSSRKIMKQ